MHDILHYYDGKTVVVTGASGYIGGALTAALAQTSARLLLVSRQPPDRDGVIGGRAARADLRAADLLERGPWDDLARVADVIFHLAGNTSLAIAVRRPAESLASLVLPLTHLYAAARDAARAPRVVHTSTVRVYGFVPVLPAAEDVDAKPVTPWGLHNLLAEHHLRLASNQGVLDGVSLRLGNVYGESPGGAVVDERSVVNKVAALAARGADLPLWGEGNYLRDFVHIDDVVRALLAAGATAGIGGRSFNVATGHGIAVRDLFHLLAERAEAITGLRVRVRMTPWPAEETQIECRDFTADIARMSAVCGWRPLVSLSEGLDRLLACKASLHRPGSGQ